MIIGFISDAHGHGHALKRGLKILYKYGAEKIFFLGDSVGYIPSKTALKILSEENLPCVLGNHELMFLHQNFNEVNDLVYQFNKIDLNVNEKVISWLRTWPSRRLEVFNGLTFEMLHGSPCDVYHGYVYPDSDLSLIKSKADFCIMGHTHFPMLRAENGTTFLNPGSCGLPRDNGSLGSVAFIDTENQKCEILRFDISDLNKEVIETYQLHKSVIDVLSRERPFIGKFVNE